jgi:hypothetical protein
LNPNRGFKQRAYLNCYLSLLGLATLVATLVTPLLALVKHYEQKPMGSTMIAFVVSAALFSACIAYWLRHRAPDRRDTAIRLLLGCHEWGSSDPATWHPNLLQRVKSPAETASASTFVEAAKTAISKGDWCAAIWAARFCAALEDAKLGEELTNQILQNEYVVNQLRNLARHREPMVAHDERFGATPSLAKWVTGNAYGSITSYIWTSRGWQTVASPENQSALSPRRS